MLLLVVLVLVVLVLLLLLLAAVAGCFRLGMVCGCEGWQLTPEWRDRRTNVRMGLRPSAPFDAPGRSRVQPDE